MSLEEFRRVQKLMKLLREIKRLKSLLRGLPGPDKREAAEGWLQNHQEDLPRIEARQLEEIREAAEYDQDEWNKVIQQLTEKQDD